MKKQSIIKTASSIVGLVLIFAVIIAAFVYKQEIENFAITGYLGVFVACTASTASILLPAPGIFIVIQYAQLLNPVLVIILGGLGTALGDMLGYYLGKNGTELVQIKPRGKILSLFKKLPYKAVFLFSVLPLPFFDFVGICAGAVKLNSFKFLCVCFLGKAIKMAFYVMLFYYAKDFLSFII